MLVWSLLLWKYSFREGLWAGSLCWGHPDIGAKVWGGNREGGQVNTIKMIYSKMWYEADPPQQDVWEEDKKNLRIVHPRYKRERHHPPSPIPLWLRIGLSGKSSYKLQRCHAGMPTKLPGASHRRSWIVEACSWGELLSVQCWSKSTFSSSHGHRETEVRKHGMAVHQCWLMQILPYCPGSTLRMSS